MKLVSEWLTDHFGIAVGLQEKLLSTLAAILVLLILRKIILYFLSKKVDDLKIQYKWRKSLTYLVSFIALLIITRIWFHGFDSFATFFGLISAGFVITLKDPILNFAGWGFIIIRKPFTVGDRIEINNVAGDIIDIRIFQFTLMEIGNWVDSDQSTGRMIHIPNGKVFTEYQANYSTGFNYIWNEIAVLITFESDWKKANQILLDIVNQRTENLTTGVRNQIKETSRKFMVFYSVLTPTVYTSMKENGVKLTMRFLCDVRKRRSTEQSIWEDVLDEFAEHDDIKYTYHTTRFFDNLTEGKPGTKPKG